MTVQARIFEQFEQVAREQEKAIAPLSNDLVLLESGLDSLCFAIVVAKLEDELGVDPLHRFGGCLFSRHPGRIREIL